MTMRVLGYLLRSNEANHFFSHGRRRLTFMCNNIQEKQRQQQQQYRQMPESRRYSKFSTHLSTERAMEMLCNLDQEERRNLREAMFKIDADKEKKQYESE